MTNKSTYNPYSHLSTYWVVDVDGEEWKFMKTPQKPNEIMIWKRTGDVGKWTKWDWYHPIDESRTLWNDLMALGGKIVEKGQVA